MNDEQRSENIENTEERPNSNYKLSKPNDQQSINDDGITYHYSRQRRLQNAPKEVQDIYKDQKIVRIGLFGSLIADKPRKILFFSIIFLCVVIIVLSRMGFFQTTHILDGNKIDISGTRFEGNTIVTLIKTSRNSEAYAGAVEIAVTVPVKIGDEQFTIFTHRIFFTFEKVERYRFAVPFDEAELLMVLHSERSTLQLRFNPE